MRWQSWGGDIGSEGLRWGRWEEWVGIGAQLLYLSQSTCFQAPAWPINRYCVTLASYRTSLFLYLLICKIGIITITYQSSLRRPQTEQLSALAPGQT